MLKTLQPHSRLLLTALMAAGLSLLLGSCASRSPAPQLEEQAEEATASAPDSTPIEADSPFDEPPQDIVYGHFSPDVLSRVILAEMAGQRGMNQQALNAYLDVARETRDLGIIKRASRIATFMREPEASTEMVQLWLEQEPDSAEAYQTLAMQMLAMGRYHEALAQLEMLQEMGHEVDFQVVPRRASIDDQVKPDLPALVADFEDLSQHYPENQNIRLSLAQLYEQNDQKEEALALVDDLAEELDYPAEVITLEAQLLESMDRADEALDLLHKGVRRHPESRQLRFMLGRRLVAQEELEGAREQFNAIIKHNPDDLEILYSLSLINLEMNRLNEARRHLQVLAQQDFRPNDVHYYLGYISEQNSENEAAINHYLKVDAGGNFLPAQRDLTELMIRTGRYDEARQRLQRLRYTSPEYNLPLLGMEASVLLDEGYNTEAGRLLDSALTVYPNNLQLLYLRSVLSTERNDLALMEQDLRRIIELNPDSPVAYNSLGYILADRTERYEEAYDLIMTAYEMAPNDPSIIDSLGWVQYRLGMLEAARENLETAFSLFPDPEVAAHLGEVLWVLGEKRQANRIWENALDEQPDSEHVLDAMRRLIPEDDS